MLESRLNEKEIDRLELIAFMLGRTLRGKGYKPDIVKKEGYRKVTINANGHSISYIFDENKIEFFGEKGHKLQERLDTSEIRREIEWCYGHTQQFIKRDYKFANLLYNVWGLKND